LAHVADFYCRCQSEDKCGGVECLAGDDRSLVERHGRVGGDDCACVFVVDRCFGCRQRFEHDSFDDDYYPGAFDDYAGGDVFACSDQFGLDAMTVRDPSMRRFKALGTVCEIGVTDPAAVDVVLSAVAGEIAECDKACSRFRDDSDLSRLNAGKGRQVEVSGRLLDDLAEAVRAAEVTAGVVDPTVGRALVLLGYDRDFDLSPTRIATSRDSRRDLPLRRFPGGRPCRLIVRAGGLVYPAVYSSTWVPQPRPAAPTSPPRQRHGGLDAGYSSTWAATSPSPARYLTRGGESE
jgi:hypothetical protein